MQTEQQGVQLVGESGAQDGPRVEQPGGGRFQRRVIVRYVAAALMLYGGLGVAVHFRLLALFYTGLSGWLGLGGAPVSLSWMEPLQAHYDGHPWLPWAAWLVGVGLLTFGNRIATGAISVGSAPLATEAKSKARRTAWRGPALLLGLLLLAGFARMVLLLPQDVGLSENPYDDEGVYAGASQLFIQGIVPYRDYFFAHPPLAAITYAPAMAYHFTEWGSPTSFMMARYLSVAYSLATLALIFLLGLRLAGLWAGTIAGLLWTVDGRVVEINRKVMLDGPMVLLSCAGLLLYLWARPYLAGDEQVSRPKRPLLVLFFAGICAALSALTKIAGVACLLAILLDVTWLWLNGRFGGKRAMLAQSQVRGLGVLLGGVLLAAAVVLGPFLVIAPSQIIRDVFFFQLLRPGDGIVDIPARVADLTADMRDPLTLLIAATGFIVLSLAIWLRRAAGAWWVVAIWMFLSVLLFTYSRSYYQHYYIQLAAPICLLGAGLSLLPEVVRRLSLSLRQARAKATIASYNPQPTTNNPQRLLYLALGAAIAALVSLPLFWAQWQGIVTRRPDHIFEIVGRYVNDAVPPGTPVLSTDEQFNILAARPPSHNATGYLVDSYGHMIALGIGLNTRSWSDLISSALKGEHGIPASATQNGVDPEAAKHVGDVYGAMLRPEAQADFLDRASRVPLIVLHTTGLNRLTAATQQAIAAEDKLVEQYQERYYIYRSPQPVK